jgi:hypothetical protein
MPTTTSKGYQYPTIVGGSSTDTVTSWPPIEESNVLLHEARPGVSSVTTTARNAFTGVDLWDGRIIWNQTTLQLEKYDLGTTSWVKAVSLAPATTVDGPDAFGDAAAVGTSLLYARGDHKHGLPSVASLATAASVTSEAGTRAAADTTIAAAVVTEAGARATADGLLLPKLNGVLTSAIESAYITGVALAATQEIDVTTNSTFIVVTTNAINDFVFNIRSTNVATLDSLLGVGQSVTVTVLVKQGATAYKCTGVEVDGGAQTVHWQGGLAPTAGFASGIDAYTVQITKTAAATFTVLASLTQF